VSETQLAKIRSEPDYRYRDPLAEAPGGEACAGYWIAAAETVRLPSRGLESNDRADSTDLLVLVQVSAGAATAPVEKLGHRLAVVGVLALAVVVLVIVALWLVVLRILGVSARSQPRETSSDPKSTPFHSIPTITADGRETH